MELAAKRFADTVALFPTGRIDHATADSFKAALAPHLAAVAAGRDRAVKASACVWMVSRKRR